MRRLVFRCDDSAGFELSILQANDGDFHISVVPNRDDLVRENGELSADLYAPCYSASVRIRMPMIGGGAHDRLWHALAKVFRHFSHPKARIPLGRMEVSPDAT